MGRSQGRPGFDSPKETASFDAELAILEKRFRVDLTFWVSTEPRIALRILRLIEEVVRSPFTGVGKPEQLKYGDRGTWARRITAEHRLTYRIKEQRAYFVTARYHYG